MGQTEFTKYSRRKKPPIN